MKTQSVDISVNNEVLYLQSPQQRVILEKAPIYNESKTDTKFNPYAVEELSFTPSEPHDCDPSRIHITLESITSTENMRRKEFTYLSKNLISHSCQEREEFVRVCELNGSACEDIKRIDLRDAWYMVGQIFENVQYKSEFVSEVIETPSDPRPSENDNLFILKTLLESDEDVNSNPDTDTDDNDTQTDSSNDTDSSTEEELDNDDFSNRVNEQLIVNESHQLLHHDGMFSNEEDELENGYSTSDEEDDFETNSTDNSTQFQLDKGPPTLTLISISHSHSHHHHEDGECIHPIEKIEPLNKIVDHENLAKNLFDYYSSSGDVQMCAVLW
eukprot:CAMPEP_0117421446 /NCGR_PEP_ID=MMETSP0758-20121206/2538_1 /TAXON_ID=63605 /ORGANISM="Percolomonas cosmopolitus, Strain AE-1 (ATCC 50343)" /LENGTH=327 /DNA_ID=CAMNT_0005203579 /DNA_START=993 /DNA_END=1973 /DNA_ORIENTATION=+